MADGTFEQQVAGALLIEIKHHTEAFFGLGGDPTPAERYLAEHLAPRVAAALLAAESNGAADGWGRAQDLAIVVMPILRGTDG